MNRSHEANSIHPLSAVTRSLAVAQLAVAALGLGCAVAYAISDELAKPLQLGYWDQVPAPLVVTVCAVASLILARREHYGGAATAAILPLATHLLVVVDRLSGLPFERWSRYRLTSPFMDVSASQSALLTRIAVWASMAAIVLGAAIAIGLVKAARRKEGRFPATAGAPEVVAVIAALAIGAYWVGTNLSQGPFGGGSLPDLAKEAFIALVAAVVAVLIDAHTRWSAGEGMTTVSRVSAGLSGIVLSVPLVWVLWPVVEDLLENWSRPYGGAIYGRGFGPGPSSYSDSWQGYADALMALGRLLQFVAVVAAALTVAHRLAAAGRDRLQRP